MVTQGWFGGFIVRRMAEVGRGIWSSPCPSLLLKHLEQVAQDHVQRASECVFELNCFLITLLTPLETRKQKKTSRNPASLLSPQKTKIKHKTNPPTKISSKTPFKSLNNFDCHFFMTGMMIFTLARTRKWTRPPEVKFSKINTLLQGTKPTTFHTWGKKKPILFFPYI